MKQLIRKILKEETFKDEVKRRIADDGVEATAPLFGGVENLVNVLYDGDIKQFYKENNYVPFKISNDGMSMYIDDLLVHSLNLPDHSKKEKILGDFVYGPKDFLRYKLTARLYSGITSGNGQKLSKVVGVSGDSGFGYSFITKRNTLGKRNRAQIFQQIIDKYDLNSYL
jgi:hypothetical protein